MLGAINNKSDLDTIERAVRGQEEELPMPEAHGCDLPRHRRSFWVEESGERGLLGETELEEMDDHAGRVTTS